MPTRVTTLGRLAVHHRDEELVTLLGQPVRCALLVYLAVEREASRDTLMALLWPDSPEEKARHALSQTMYELRRLLGDGWAIVEGERVRVAPDVVCDAVLFEAAVEANDDDAPKLYRGAFLEDARLAETNAFETWTDQQRARLARLNRKARRQSLDRLIAAADRDAALAAAREWAELEPLDDEAQHRFIELLAGAGLRTEALDEYELYVKRLRDELEVEPLDETRELVERIRAGEVGPQDAAASETAAPEPVPESPQAPEPAASAARDEQAAPAAAKVVSAPTRRDLSAARRRGLAWAAAVALAAVIAVWMIAALQGDDCEGGVGPGCTPPPDPATFVVFEPRIEASGAPRIPAATYAYHLRDAVARWRDLRLADPLRVADALNRRNIGPDDVVAVDTALAVARELGAGRLIMSVVQERSSEQGLLEARLYDVATGQEMDHAQLPVPLTEAALDSVWVVVAALITPGGMDRLPTRSSLPASLAAHRAYADGEDALAAWKLDEAVERFREAIARDTTFADAYLRLAQSLDWAGRHDDLWRDAADGAVAHEHILDGRERLLAAAELALAEERFPDACRLFTRVVEQDSSSFAGWYGLGECRARDDVVVPDPSSPSGFGFRASYHTANRAYRRALEILPSFNFHAFRNGPYAGLTRTLFTDPLAVRTGRRRDQPEQVFAAYPTLQDDTLAFIPYAPELAEQLRPGPGALHSNRETLRRIVGAWARAFPGSAQANHAWALVLESFGEIQEGPPESSAPGAVRRALDLTDDPIERLALAVTRARLALKRGDFDVARDLADSVSTAWAEPDDRAAAYLAGLEALRGRPHRAANLFGQAAGRGDPYTIDLPIQPPRRLLQTARTLWVYAGFGMAYEQSILERDRDTRLFIRTLIEPRFERQAQQALLSTPAIMLFHERGHSEEHLDVPWNPIISMQRDLAIGDSAGLAEQLALTDELRDPFRPGDFPVHETLAIAHLYLAVSDTAGAVRTLDGVLETLFTLNRRVLDLPHETAALVHAMALRARLAHRAGDADAAREWATAVTTLWSGGDPGLQPLVDEMARLARRAAPASPPPMASP